MRHLNKIMSVLLLLAAFGCSKVDEKGMNTGFVSFSVSSDNALTEMTKSSVSDYTSVMPAYQDFILTVRDADSAVAWSGKVSELTGTLQLTSGNYTVTASYGDVTEEGFDKPCFIGSASFSVEGDKTVEVEVPVRLANSVVKFTCTESFRNYFRSCSVSLKGSSDNTFSFAYGSGSDDFGTSNQTRGVFVENWQVEVTGVFSTGSKNYNFSRKYTNLEAATVYSINFNITNTGGAVVEISFAEDLETIELEDIELND